MYNRTIIGKEDCILKKTTAIMRCLSLILTLVLMAGVSAMAEPSTYDVIYSASNPIPEIAANTRPSIVQITNSVEYWNPVTREGSEEPMGYGSACYIRAAEDGQGGYLLTNYHVVQDGDVFSALWLDGTEMELTLVGYDDGTDIAVLRFDEAAPEGAAFFARFAARPEGLAKAFALCAGLVQGSGGWKRDKHRAEAWRFLLFTQCMRYRLHRMHTLDRGRRCHACCNLQPKIGKE